MASVAQHGLHRAENLRANLRRIFDTWGVQARVAKDAGIHFVHINRILSGTAPNPKLETVERLSIALEIPVETLIASHPSDLDLRIFSSMPKAS